MRMHCLSRSVGNTSYLLYLRDDSCRITVFLKEASQQRLCCDAGLCNVCCSPASYHQNARQCRVIDFEDSGRLQNKQNCFADPAKTANGHTPMHHPIAAGTLPGGRCSSRQLGESRVSQSEQYRRFSRECLEMAEEASDRRLQVLMIHMAQVWLRLAQEHEAPAELPSGER